jgi:hypothetical protein
LGAEVENDIFLISHLTSAHGCNSEQQQAGKQPKQTSSSKQNSVDQQNSVDRQTAFNSVEYCNGDAGCKQPRGDIRRGE